MEYKSGVAFTSAIIIGSVFTMNAQTDDRPNIIFLLTDDQAVSTIAAYGFSEAVTPNIDSLANNGVMFMNHYNNTSISMASRAICMTGRYEFSHGSNFHHGSVSEEIFLQSYPVLLRNSGYKTGFIGKFGFPVNEAGDTNLDYSSVEFLPDEHFDWWKGWPRQGSYETIKNDSIAHYAEEFPHTTRAVGEVASDFISEFANGDEPFCLSVSFKAPHLPFDPDPAYDSVYADKIWTKPENYGLINGVGLAPQASQGRHYRQFRTVGWGPQTYHETRSAYNQLVHGIDVAVGRIVEELKAKGEDDNTIIIFTADNGHFNGSHGFNGKALPYEEASLAPLIVFDPRDISNHGNKVWGVTGSVDLAPTILELAGVEKPAGMDGISLKPMLDNPENTIRDYVLHTQMWGPTPIHAMTIITEDWKYIYWPYEGEGMLPATELYDLNNDSLEMINKSGQEEFADVELLMESYFNEALQYYKDHNVKRNNYEEFEVIFDRGISWANKIPFIDSVFIDSYNDIPVSAIKNEIYLLYIGGGNSAFTSNWIRSESGMDWYGLPEWNRGGLIFNDHGNFVFTSEEGILTSSEYDEGGLLTFYAMTNSSISETNLIIEKSKDNGLSWELLDSIKAEGIPAMTYGQHPFYAVVNEDGLFKLRWRTDNFNNEIVMDDILLTPYKTEYTAPEPIVEDSLDSFTPSSRFNAMTIYPNPVEAGETINIELPTDRISENYSVKVYSLSGKLVTEKMFMTANHFTNSGLFIEDEGVHLLFIETDKRVFISKILVVD
ncbi:MAG: sulfatase-like hydrolase/transferase [Bacteroidales bacterium]|nr:sulfatase-like hydrolase/transferase [Bacteroidales bacterium]